jgi:hypothetical protein
MDPTSGIRLMERRQYAVPHSEAQSGCGPLQGSGLAKNDPVIEDPWIGADGRDPNQIQGDDNRRSGYPL